MVMVERAVEILHIHFRRCRELAHIGEAGGLAGLLAGLREDREQDSGQDGDNSDDDEQFDEGKPLRLRAAYETRRDVMREHCKLLSDSADSVVTRMFFS